MKIHFIDRKLNEIDADLEIVFVVNKNFDHRWVKKQKPLLEKLGFKGESEETVLLPESGKLIAAVETIDHENIRLAAAAAIKAVKGTFPRIKMGLYLDGSDKNGTAAALAEGLLLGDYRFDTYKSTKSEHRIDELYISRSEYSNRKFDPSKIEAFIERARIHCETVNTVRDIINTPPEEATPVKLAAMAAELAAEQKLQCHVYDEDWIRDSGMGAFYAVGKASDNPPRLVHLTYAPQNPRARVVLVGKGITYDTGGLSLKPTTSMTTMKADKSGAVSVLGILLAASRMKLDIEVHGLLGAAENMVSGRSYRPDDILTARNGKTIEVKNTDAEGRLVLADCLCYAQELEPDYIIDMATLTGGCVIALGEYTFGVLGHNEKLKESILSAARNSGELAHSLPFNRYLKKLLKSEVADVPNIGGTKYGSASIAGLFLSEFIAENYRDRWIHLDIAGPAFVEKPWAFNPAGASGAGVRTMLTWLESLS